MADRAPDDPAGPGGHPAPTAERPLIPAGYGLPTTTDGVLAWGAVEERLRSAKHYWLATVRPDGTPHVVPRWGVWLDGRFYYDGSPATRHARNLTTNPACTLNLESGTEVVIIEGGSARTSAPTDPLGTRLAAEFGKYAELGYEPAADSWSAEDGGGLCVLSPKRAFAWFSFPHDCTRFRFD